MASPSGSNGSKKLFTIGIPLIFLIGAAIAISSSILDSPVSVKAVTVTTQSEEQENALLTASGYVVAQRKASVASKATGRLVYLGVAEGDKVRKDQIIARLEDNDVKAALDEAKANLELNEATLADAKWNYDRDTQLLKSGSITQSTFRTAETQYLKAKASVDVAEANVEAAEVAVENTLVRAPFDGTVLTKNADVGEIVAPMAGGTNSRGTVVTIADMSSLEVEADVSESNIEKVKMGQNCQITLDAYPDYHYEGYVAKIVPTADRAKATVTVKIAFRKYDDRVLPEMGVKVLFLGNNKPGSRGDSQKLVLPLSAIVNRDGNIVVFKIKDNRVIKTPVATRQIAGGYAEITSGLSEGDQVVDSPGDRLKDGTKVNLQ